MMTQNDADVTTDATTAAPVPALLPHDWRRQLTEFLDAMWASHAARQAAFAFVEAWVSAASETATTDAPDEH